MKLRPLALAAALVVAGIPAPALAIVRARDAQTGQPLRLRDREIALTLSATHASRDLPTEAVMAALRRAAARWTTDVGCTGVTFRVLPPSPAADRARRDGVNAVLFHEQAWCRDGVRDRFAGYDREESEGITRTTSARGALTMRPRARRSSRTTAAFGLASRNAQSRPRFRASTRRRSRTSSPSAHASHWPRARTEATNDSRATTSSTASAAAQARALPW